MDEVFNKLRKIQEEIEAKKRLEDELQLEELKNQSMSTPVPFKTPFGFGHREMPDIESGYFVEEPSLASAIEKDPYTRYKKLKEKLNK